MSFLDSLENNLKALEATAPSGLDDRKRKEIERQRAEASAPWADKLKRAPYTQALMEQASRAGYQIRTKVTFVWLADTLRMEARGYRFELRPTPRGILAVHLKGIDELHRELIDLAATPEALLKNWMAVLASQKQEDDAAAAQSLIDEENRDS
jgi:hypothetical protein